MKASSLLLAPLCVLLVFGVGCQKSGSDDDNQDDSSDDDDNGKDDSNDQPDEDEPDDEPDPEVCAGDPCSIVEQCGCGTDQACDLDPAKFAEGGALCRTTTETGTEETLCDSATDCATGYGCIGGACALYCGDAEDCGEGGRCDNELVYVDGNDDVQAIPDAKVCSKSCRLDLTPVDGGCPNDPSIGCRVKEDADGLYTDCELVNDSGSGKQEYDCIDDLDCARGFGCFTHEDDGRLEDECLEMCVAKVDGKAVANTCAGGRTCFAITGLTIGNIDYGACDD
jgi:hypothetical protein